ncbi:MAG: Spy0128 family protein [Ruminococcus sp.]
MINKTSKVAARSLTAIALIVMIIISCISAVAVNKSVAESGAKKDIEVTGGTMTKGVDYYLVGDMCSPIWSTADTSFALTKVNGDNNNYTGTFRLTGQKTYEFKIYNSNGDYYSKSGASFSEGTQIVRGLTNDAGASNMSFVIPAGTTEITVDMYCEYSNDSQVTFTLNNLGTGDVTQGGTGHSYKAQSGVINHSSDTELLNVKSTFFDYYNDEEVDGSWRTSLSGFYRTVKSGNTSHNREPYEKFNRAIAQYANGVNNSSWTTPLYFGDFNTDKDGYQKDGYAGYGVSNLKKFLSVPNNSNATSSGTSGSVAGLADVTLADNKKLSKNGVTMPYFDEDWLVNNGYGTVVHSDFPMRKTTDKHGQDYYEYDSLNGKDNCYFDGYENLASGGNLTMNYAGGKSNSVYDALSGFSKSTSNNPGFFPFDRQKDHSNNGYDFGFGMRLDLDFTLGANGKTNGENTVFNFSGDDDLWVYLDGVLVLDMGGDHKMSQGCIDFTTLKSYVNNIDTKFQGTDLVYKNDTSKSGYGYSAEFPLLFSDSTARTGSSKFNNNKVNAHHTLTVFYMERGMIESNLKVGFNFEPITDSLDVTKTVDTSNVNTKLQTAVKNADDFGFAIKENGADVSNKKYKYSDNGTINNAKTNGNTATLSDGDSASFNSQFTIDNNLTVTEGTPKKTIISNMDTDSLIYLDTNDMSCSWFFNNGAVPAISFDNGNTFHQMFSYQTDGRTIYYYESEKDSSSNKSFIIGRKDDMGVWNRVRFSAITENTNCINVKAWRSTSTGDISVVDNSGSISEVTKFALTPPSSGDYTIDTTKESLLAGHYNTNWSLYDVSGTSPDLITTGDTKVSNFKYKNKADDDLVSTHLRLDYVNTPQVANIKVNKNVVDKSGNTITDDDTQFDVTLKLDINGDGAYQDYGLTGKISQSSPYTFTGIPVGVKYKVEEHTPSGYKVSYGTVNTTNTGILGNAGATVDVINTVTPASITAGITKTLDRMFYDGSTFQFKLVGLASTTVGGVTTEDTSSVTDTISTVDDGNAAFNSIDYSTEGTYLYKITEEPLVDGHDYQTDSSVYIFKVVVAKDNGVLKATGTYYRGASSQSVEEIVDANNTTNIASFKNTSTKAQATVLKADKVNPDGTVPADAKKLEGAEFTLYKVDADRSKDNMVKVATATTDSNGEITFTDLDIFKSGKNGNGGTKEYQWYYVVETASAEGYTLSTNEQWFSFDGGHYDSTKNVYTHSFAALNTLITVPYAGINYLMQHNFILYGTLVLGLGAICSCGYMLRKRRLGAKAPTNKHGRK